MFTVAPVTSRWALAASPGYDLARVDAGPRLEAEAPPELDFVDGAESVAHLKRRADRTEGVVLVCDGHPEDGHDRVADVLLDRSTVAVEGSLHGSEVGLEDGLERHRVEPLREGCRVREVREDDSHGPPSIGRRGLRCERHAAGSAEAEAVRVLLTATRADLHALECIAGVR